MKEAYRLALQHSYDRKAKDVSKNNDRKAKDVSKNNTKRPCLTTLEPSGRVLIWNLSERG